MRRVYGFVRGGWGFVRLPSGLEGSRVYEILRKHTVISYNIVKWDSEAREQI